MGQTQKLQKLKNSNLKTHPGISFEKVLKKICWFQQWETETKAHNFERNAKGMHLRTFEASDGLVIYKSQENQIKQSFPEYLVKTRPKYSFKMFYYVAPKRIFHILPQTLTVKFSKSMCHIFPQKIP